MRARRRQARTTTSVAIVLDRSEVGVNTQSELRTRVSRVADCPNRRGLSAFASSKRSHIRLAGVRRSRYDAKSCTSWTRVRGENSSSAAKLGGRATRPRARQKASVGYGMYVDEIKHAEHLHTSPLTPRLPEPSEAPREPPAGIRNRQTPGRRTRSWARTLRGARRP